MSRSVLPLNDKLFKPKRLDEIELGCFLGWINARDQTYAKAKSEGE